MQKEWQKNTKIYLQPLLDDCESHEGIIINATNITVG